MKRAAVTTIFLLVLAHGAFVGSFSAGAAGTVSISGVVQDAGALILTNEGRGVAGAQVSVLQDPSIRTLTQPDGSFKLEGIRTLRILNLVVEGGNFQRTVSPDVVVRNDDVTGFTIQAVPAVMLGVANTFLTTLTGVVGNPQVGIVQDPALGEVLGVVVDAATGERISGASVRINFPGMQNLPIKSIMVSPSIGYPGVKGMFIIANVPVREDVIIEPTATRSKYVQVGNGFNFDRVSVATATNAVTFVVIRATRLAAPQFASSVQASISFTDVTESIGVKFRQQSALPFLNAGLYALGSGIAVNDYDNDGYLDFYITNGLGFPNGLYHNNGDGTFTDVSAEAGVGETRRESTGFAFGDIDNDGFPDLYVGNYGRNTLYHNNGDGTFTDITRRAGVGDERNARAVSFVDYNNDGFLDFYVTNFDWQFSVNFLRTDNPGQGNVLYRNNGDGTFTDVTERAGVGHTGLAFAATWMDYDNDGDQDLFVANDVGRFILFRNNGDGTFTDVSVQAGFNVTGSWMGIATGDYNNDGNIDVYVVNVGPGTDLFVGMGAPIGTVFNALYRNNGDGTFTDVAKEAGVADAGFGFGCSFADFDNDGDLDLYVVSNYYFEGPGATGDLSMFGVLDKGLGDANTFFFLNNGDGTFTEATAAVGIHDPSDARGLAIGDYNNDGFLDIFIGHERSRPIIYKNNAGNGNHWLKVKVVGTRSNRSGIGAKVRVVSNGRAQIRDVNGGSSYLSQNSFETHFGLGQDKVVDSVEVVFPSGKVVVRKTVAVNQLLTITER